MEKPEYGYEGANRVITGLEFERLVSASGPTEGHVEIDGEEPKRVVFIQCVGSRDKEGNEYCSRVCCMYTAKHAHLVGEKIPGSDLTIYFTDVRAFGKGFEEFYVRVMDEGVDYRRRELEDPIEVVQEGKKVIVKAEGHPDIKADLVVLATAIEPRTDAPEMTRILNISQSGDGFFLEAHPKLRPVESVNPGLFLAGAAQAPKDIPEVVAQASGAAAKAIAILSQERLHHAPTVAEVKPNLCTGCGMCVYVCPYDALTLKDGKAEVNEVLCEGCGTCSATCLRAAIQVKNITPLQINEMIKACLGG